MGVNVLGLDDGAAVGAAEGLDVGAEEGDWLGDGLGAEGLSEGELLGAVVGLSEGDKLGAPEGEVVGLEEGAIVALVAFIATARSCSKQTPRHRYQISFTMIICVMIPQEQVHGKSFFRVLECDRGAGP